MAEKIERTYNIPLRRACSNAPIYKKTPKAVREVRSFLQKHMKSEDVKLGKHLNLMLWENGIRNPPHHIKVNVIKDAEGKVMAELFGKKIETGEEKETKAKKKEEKPVAIPKPVVKEATPKVAPVEKEVKAEATPVKVQKPAEVGKETKVEAKPEVKTETPKVEVKKE